MIGVEISIGEAIDRMTILEIKSKRVKGPLSRKMCEEQYKAMYEKVVQSIGAALDVSPMNYLTHELTLCNQALWDLEDNILSMMAKESPDQHELSAVACAIVRWNDRRHEMKKKLDEAHGDKFFGEVKEHPSYE